MDPVIEFISKFKLCVMPPQSGKTFITIKEILAKIVEDDKYNLGRSIHIVLTMNTKIGNVQFAKRLEEIENTYGEGSVCVLVSGKYNGKYKHIKKREELQGICLNKSTCPRVVVMCTNKTQSKNEVEFLNIIDKNECCIKRAFVYYDEIHKYLNDSRRCEIEEIHNLDIVKSIIGLTATPYKTWKKEAYWSSPFWSTINIFDLNDFTTDNYVGHKDLDFHCIDDYFTDPYVRPSPFELDRQTVEFIENVLTKYPQILDDNTRSFIPAHRHLCSHYAVRDLIFRLNNKAVVVVINGPNKTLEYNDFHGKHITFDLSKNCDEICKIIADFVLQNDLQKRPYVITGLLCISMGQTLTDERTGSFTSAIFGHMDLLNDEIYQLFGRVKGRMKHWGDKCVRTQVYCPTIIMNRCICGEVCAMNIIEEHNGDTITQKDFIKPIEETEEGKAIMKNIRKEKKNKNIKPKADNIEKGWKVFKLQSDAIKFGIEKLNHKFSYTMKEDAPVELKNNGNNPTVEYILKRWWGVGKKGKPRKCITFDNQWCVWWNESLIKNN